MKTYWNLLNYFVVLLVILSGCLSAYSITIAVTPIIENVLSPVAGASAGEQ